jgi:chromosome segregation protein
MRVDKIELIGFKSFAERTTFHFHPGITCIVGPNGCGKSNVVDAFRWVLGEQSAKSLRGEKMEEVIFNGSTSKKPRGMSEVSLVLSGIEPAQQTPDGDNGEGAVSGDTAQVTRRLYRSGDSEYMLNKSQCRLKDIKDLFLDTGLEVKSYSILEQDRIAEILNAKPLDRRFLIEEVAGVMKYNVRKKEAVSKLESSRTNLQRINDITIEVKKQINLLDRLAKKAERYKKLYTEMREIELKITRRDYGMLKESFEKIVAQYTALREEETSARAELATKESRTETSRLSLVEKEKELEQVIARFQGLEREIGDIEKRIAVARTERDNNKEYLVKLHQQDEEYHTKEAEAFMRGQTLQKTEADIAAEIQSVGEILREKGDFVKSLEENLAEKEDLLEEKRRGIFRISEELSALKNEQNMLRSSLDGLEQRGASSARDSENIKKTLAEIDASIGDMERGLLEKNNELMLLGEKKGMFITEIATHRENLERLRERLSKHKEELASYSSRIESLKEIVFNASTRDLLAGELQFDLIASLSDVLEIDNQYEKAIESVLAEKVNSFVLSSFDEIEAAVSAVREKGLDRTAFIPLAAQEGGTPAEMPEGALGSALTFIRTKEEFSGVAHSLLGHIMVTKDLRAALQLKSSGHNGTFVTLDGEVVEPSGAVIVGEVKGIFRRKREIRELEVSLEHTMSLTERLQQDIQSIQKEIETKEAELRSIEARIVEREKEVSLLKLTAENTREDRERKERKLAYLTLEIEQIAGEKESVGKVLSERELEAGTVNVKKEEEEHQSAALHDEIAQKKSYIEEYRAEVTELKLTVASLKERAESAGKEKEAIRREMEEIARKKDFLSDERTSIQSRIMQRETEMQEHEQRVRTLVADADMVREDIAEKKEIIGTEQQELMTTEQGLKILRNQIDGVSHTVADLDIQKTEHKMRMEALYENVKQHYGFDIGEVKLEPVTPEDESRLDELKKKVTDMGPVNLGTLEEYEELRSRYDFLHTQQDDLHRSIAELEEAITKINTTTRKKLRDAFEALKVKFAEVFTVLFGGGRAELVMTDEHNILETGIDIIAQPPGKRLQNINLLSGGEKTLTALSLLFASFLIKPTPLCILDEADSALDEANTGKFANMVRELSKDTQFIVVTHNRNTMGVADYIYGITMEEAGISKVISMQLVEA